MGEVLQRTRYSKSTKNDTIIHCFGGGEVHLIHTPKEKISIMFSIPNKHSLQRWSSRQVTVESQVKKQNQLAIEDIQGVDSQGPDFQTSNEYFNLAQAGVDSCALQSG